MKFEGDLYDDEEMLDWLTDPNVMEISDQIEKVNKKMFEKLITRNEFLTVFFYSDTDCKQCDGVLQAGLIISDKIMINPTMISTVRIFTTMVITIMIITFMIIPTVIIPTVIIPTTVYSRS